MLLSPSLGSTILLKKLWLERGQYCLGCLDALRSLGKAHRSQPWSQLDFGFLITICQEARCVSLRLCMGASKHSGCCFCREASAEIDSLFRLPCLRNILELREASTHSTSAALYWDGT